MQPLRWLPALLLLLAPMGSAAADGVVLLIADGTSSELLTATRIYRHGVEGQLAMESMPHSAFVHTWSSDGIVTDSAAASTAMARGRKADNRSVGITEPPTPSILDLAKQAGWRTALITDDSVTGGSIAPFLVEHDNRGDMSAIAAIFVEALGKRADFLIGGGAKWFQPLDGVDYHPEELARVTATDAAIRTRAIHRIENWPDFQALLQKGLPENPVLATFWPNVAPFIADGPRSPRLADIVRATLGALKSGDAPYLLVIEAALPDKAAHANQARRAILEILEFDDAVKQVLDTVSGETLVLATTDHGTGGLALNGYMGRRLRGDLLLGINPLTGASILTWASGPGSATPSSDPDLKDPHRTQPSAIPLKAALHTGGDVWLLARGPGAGRVRGFLDNTDIFRLMKDAILGGETATNGAASASGEQ